VRILWDQRWEGLKAVARTATVVVPLVAGMLIFGRAPGIDMTRTVVHLTAAHAQVPVLPCPITPQERSDLEHESLPLPGPTPRTTQAPSVFPPRSAIYGSGLHHGPNFFTLGPVGYSCEALGVDSADGSYDQQVRASARSPLGILTIFSAGGAGPSAGIACPYIPAIAAVVLKFANGLSFCEPPSSDQVLQVPTGMANRYMAVVSEPAAYDPNQFNPGDGAPTFAVYTAQVFPQALATGQSISCNLPTADRSICVAALEFFLDRESAVGIALDSAELASADKAISAFVGSGGAITGPGSTSPIATTLPSPHQAFSSVARTAVNIAIAGAAVIFITFPAQMFNATLDENYEEILAMWRRLLWKLGGKRRLARKQRKQAAPQQKSARQDQVVFACVLIVGSIVGGFRDPRFGFNLASLANFLATIVALLVLIATPAAAATAYRKLRKKPAHPKLRAIPAGIAIAVMSVLVSRLAHFQPGYLYGLVCGVYFAHRLEKKEEGHVAWIEAASTLVVAVAAWIAFIPVDGAVLRPDPNFGLVLVDDWLASIFVGGIVGIAIGLIPLRFLPGSTLFQWNRVVWAIMFTVSIFGVVGIMLNPSSGPARPGSAPVVTAVVLFVVFGGLSVGFRQYFSKRHPAGDGESRVTAPTGVGRYR